MPFWDISQYKYGVDKIILQYTLVPNHIGSHTSEVESATLKVFSCLESINNGFQCQIFNHH